jgi:hypothetical protein
MNDHLTLKWGTLKAWHFHRERGQQLLREYCEIGHSLGAMTQIDTPRQKEIICELIGECDDPQGVYLSWDGNYVDKETAKRYVMTYGKDRQVANASEQK